MIFQKIIDVFFSIVEFLIGLLPDPDTLPSGIGTAFSSIGTYLRKANAILPVDTMITIMGLTLAVEGGILAFIVLNWIYNKIRGSG